MRRKKKEDDPDPDPDPKEEKKLTFSNHVDLLDVPWALSLDVLSFETRHIDHSRLRDLQLLDPVQQSLSDDKVTCTNERIGQTDQMSRRM